MEFSYVGQSFENMSTEYASITVKAEPSAFYENDYVVTLDNTNDLTLNVKLQKLKEQGGRVDNIKIIDLKLPQQHYTWLTLKVALLDAI